MDLFSGIGPLVAQDETDPSIQLREHLLAHPEDHEVVLRMADYVGSTTGILDFATKSEKRVFIVATEPRASPAPAARYTGTGQGKYFLTKPWAAFQPQTTTPVPPVSATP